MLVFFSVVLLWLGGRGFILDCGFFRMILKIINMKTSKDIHVLFPHQQDKVWI